MEIRRKVIVFDMILPSILFILLMATFQQTTLDHTLASHFYSPKHKWIYRNNTFLEVVLHKGGAKFVLGIFIILLGYLYYSFKFVHDKKPYKLCKFVIISSLLAIILTSLLKNVSTWACPWNSLIFGGQSSNLSLWNVFSTSYPPAHCFPSGHASGGYGFLSLYYGFCFIYGKRNFYCLIPGIFLGGIFGITQQIRGAHFMSHDFATIIVSIFSAWVTYLILNYYNNLHES
ncbi:phosphatase PAP2 family protein [Verminephrobacter aporrectodeae subsp. tuberculatae]|nr:phosphatase PAP2 family protein [Verminephrobacter aporrectodeae subsp. tuberculatae]